MRAAWYSQLGGPEVLTVGDRETPEPGPGEVRVRLATSGVNPSDWKARKRGRDGKMPFETIVPHSDGAGTIDAVGVGVDAARIGRRAWVMNGQWKRPFGTAAEYICQAEKYVVDLPDGADLAEAACFGIPFLTAYRAVMYDGAVAGKTILVSGGAGAVGHHAIQVANANGARVLTTISSDEKAAYAKAAGADETINYRSEDVAKRVQDITGGLGADRIVELNISANAPLYDRILAPRGVAVIYGTNDPVAEVPAQAFIPRGAELKWFIVYELLDADRETGIAALNAMLAAGTLKTTVAARFPLAEIQAAHRMVEEARHMGNVVLDVA
jgi:NADPH2:quinone reductase